MNILPHRQKLAELEARYQLRRHRAICEKRRFAYRVENDVRQRLEQLGYTVSKPTSAIEHYDLLAHSPGCAAALRVEVKAARWANGRYAAAMRSNAADVLILVCCGVDQEQSCFVIPFEHVQGLQYLKVTSRNPGDYQGQWARFLGAWDVLERLVDQGVNSWQLELFGGVL